MAIPDDELSQLWEAYERDPSGRSEWLRNKLSQIQTASLHAQVLAQQRANRLLVATAIVAALAAFASVGTFVVEWRSPDTSAAPPAPELAEGEDRMVETASHPQDEAARGGKTVIMPGCAASFLVPEGFGNLDLEVSPSLTTNESRPFIVTIEAPGKSTTMTLQARLDVTFHATFREADWAPGLWNVRSGTPTEASPASVSWIATATASREDRSIPVQANC